MSNGFDVEIEALRRAAFVAGQLGDTIVSAVAVQGFGSAVEQSLPGGRAAKYSHGLEKTWEKHIRDWAEKARAYQTRLASSADLYTEVEESIVKSMGRCDR